MITLQIDSKALSELIEIAIHKAFKEFTTQSVDPAPKDKMLTAIQAAEFLNITIPTLYSKTSKGEIPVMKRNKRLYFSQLELMEYLRSGRKRSNDDIEKAAKVYLNAKSDNRSNFNI